jgi:telomere length regulation protein
MDELLLPVRSTKKTSTPASQLKVVEVTTTPIKDFDGALEALRNAPSSSQLKKVLNFLLGARGKTQDAKAAQITNVLIAETLPSWWEQLQGDGELLSLKSSLTDYLCEVTALSLLVSRLKILTALFRSLSQAGDGASIATQLKTLLEVLEATIGSDDTIRNVHRKCTLAATIPRQTLWRESISLISSGRLVSTVAEAEDALRSRVDSRKTSWMGRGNEYCKWLARNVAAALVNVGDDDRIAHSALAALTGKALTIGYQGILLVKGTQISHD